MNFYPRLHGFDEFFGYLYHLDAMEDPAHPNYPQNLLNEVGPRNMVHSYATNVDDPTDMPRWGKVGKQKIEDAGTLYPKRMETVDDEIRDFTLSFIDKSKKDNKPFFSSGSIQPACTSLRISRRSTKRRGTRRMAGQKKKLAWRSWMTMSVWSCKRLKISARMTTQIVVFTTDNGTEVFTWPDGGQTPFCPGEGNGP